MASLDDMTAWLRQRIALGTPRMELRDVLAKQGGATRIVHPGKLARVHPLR